VCCVRYTPTDWCVLRFVPRLAEIVVRRPNKVLRTPQYVCCAVPSRGQSSLLLVILPVVIFMKCYCRVGILKIFWSVKGTCASGTPSCVLSVGLYKGVLPLARPGRKQATATKLGIYSTFSPQSSIHSLAHCSIFCHQLKKMQKFFRPTRSPRQQ
jgi:hypothetical protein